MELAIQTLLKENGQKITTKLSNLSDQTPTAQISPETYLGSTRMQYYFPSGNLSNGEQNFTLSNTLDLNSFSYGGIWTITNDYATTSSNSSLNYNFVASKVFIILRPGSSNSGSVKVYLDGKLIDPSTAGTDVQNGIISVDSDRLYNVIDLHGKTESHTLQLNFQNPGIRSGQP